MGRQQVSANYRGYRTAGIRLSEELLPHLADRPEALDQIVSAIHDFDKAHLVMLVEEKLIAREPGVAMLNALREMEKRGVESTRKESGGGIHSGEQYLIRKLGEDVGGRIHLGRSSGDLDEIGRRMAFRKQLLELFPLLLKFRRTLLRLADEHAETVMPAYTHGQNGQTSTFGHWLSMWASVFARDFDRLRSFYGRVNVSPAGAAIMTGSDFPLNRARTAQLLGFSQAIPHTMDAILSHDLELECGAVLAVFGSDLGRLGDDLMLWASTEFAMIDVPDRFCVTSSIMMQKKNPAAPQEMKALAAESAGAAMLTFMLEKGPTGLPILERRTAERAFWSVFASAKQCLGDVDDLISALIVDKERMRSLAGAFWAQGTDLAGALVREKDLPWRTAHQIVGILIRHCIERRIMPLDVDTKMLDEAAVEYMDKPVGLSPLAIKNALDPAYGVTMRTLFGGPAPASARRELGTFLTTLGNDAEWLKEAESNLAAAAAALEAGIDAIVRP
jgi:argininosuccinate lyase